MRNLKLILAYDGADFAGWQVQPDRVTIQGTLATVIGRLTGENVLPQGSGRTDAGVHALAQVATFPTASPIPIDNWIKALNDLLPPSIRVLEITEVPADFHARKSARAKTYRYRIYRGDVCPPFLARYVWHYPFPLDEAAMISAAGLVVGEHDFTSFAAVDPERVQRIAAFENDSQRVDPARANLPSDPSFGSSSNICHPEAVGPLAQRGAPNEGSLHLSSDMASPGTAMNGTMTTNVRTVYSSAWSRQGDEFVYTVRGSGFLHHMVRNLVGTFMLVGKGTLNCTDFGRILTARDRSAAGPTAPASGLYLVGVEY